MNKAWKELKPWEKLKRLDVSDVESYLSIGDEIAIVSCAWNNHQIVCWNTGATIYEPKEGDRFNKRAAARAVKAWCISKWDMEIVTGIMAI